MLMATVRLRDPGLPISGKIEDRQAIHPQPVISAGHPSGDRQSDLKQALHDWLLTGITPETAERLTEQELRLRLRHLAQEETSHDFAELIYHEREDAVN